MTIRQALIDASSKLNKRRITSASLDAEVLLSHVLKKPREFLFTYPEKTISTYQIKNFRALITRRAKHEPIAYLTGHKEFYGLDFIVNKSVLIPRPETEILVEAVIKEVKNLTSHNSLPDSQPTTHHSLLTIADIGTGSGCIAIALAKTLNRELRTENIKIIAIDKSTAAIKVAKLNAKKHNVEIQFKQGNLLEPLKNQKVDIIVANLPYLRNQLDYSDHKIIKYEPALALKGGPDGLKIYRQLYKQLNKLKNKPKVVYLEM